MTDKTDGGNVVEIDRMRARKVLHEKAAARAIELHDKGKDFDESIKKAVKEGRLDTLGETFVRAQLIAHNLSRAVAQVRKQLDSDPSLSVDVLSQQAARAFENIKPQAVKSAYESSRARELILAFLKTIAPADATIGEVVAATSLAEPTIKAAVDKKTIFWTGRRGSEWLLGTAPKLDKTAKQSVIEFLTANGNSFIADVARGTGLKEKVVKDQVDKKEIFWIEKKDDQWIIGLEKKSKEEAAAADADPRVIIDFDPNNLQGNVDAAIQALLSLPDLYVSGGKLARLFVDQEHAELITLSYGTLLTRLAASTRWRVWTIDKYTKERTAAFGPPPKAIVSSILDQGIYPGLPEILGISRLPIVHRAADEYTPLINIKLNPGFVRTEGLNSGYYMHAPVPWTIPTVHEGRLLQHDAEEALEQIEMPLVDFPFDNPRVAKSVFVAALLTLILRPMIRGAVPGLLIEAPTAGSGKGLFLDIVSIVALGKGASRIPIPVKTWFDREGGAVVKVDEEELEKRLAGYAERAEILVPFDNCNGEIGGGSLESVLTAVDEVDFRSLGKTTIHRVRWRGMLTFNGNNPELIGDMHRRLMRIRLVPKETNPALSTKKYTYGNDDKLRRWVLDKRRHLVQCLLLMIKAYFDAVRPSSWDADGKITDWDKPQFNPGNWGSYTSWTELIPNIIMYAGGENPLKSRPIKDAASMVSDEDDNLRILANAVDLLLADKKDKTPSVKLVTADVMGITISTLLEHLELREMDERLNDARNVIKEMLGKPKRLSNDHVRKLNKRLLKFDDKITDGRRFVVSKDRDSRPAIGFQRLEAIQAGCTILPSES